MPQDSEITKVVNELRKMKNGGAFLTFIDHIVFPKYRNIKPNARIDFQFPVTAFVGQNGSGKTGVLQALYGAPTGYSVGKWWFETAVDPIDETPRESEGIYRSRDIPHELRSAFWYGYRHQGEDRYVLKTRIKRRNDPDYWEPSRPVAAYGLKTLPNGKRFDPIAMDRWCPKLFESSGLT